MRTDINKKLILSILFMKMFKTFEHFNYIKNEQSIKQFLK